MRIGNKIFDGHTYVMGILNVTPDSFFDGGKWGTVDIALKHTEDMIKEGADIIDIGGESTRPGYTKISDEEETERLIPVIEAVRRRFSVPISADTYKSAVAEAALSAGADMINDIWGFKYDENMAGVVKKYNAACCLMHNRKNADYSDFLADVCSDLRESVMIAQSAGIDRDKIILDPGVGFAKSFEQNLFITKNLDAVSSLGYPVLLGTSRKSMIGLALGLPAGKRLEGTIATTVFAALKKCLFVRVHDVGENVRAIKMTEAIMNQDNY